MQILMALVAGLVFGLGLIAGGMTNPAKVLGFLDLAGRWDPSLAFVMGGAVLVGFFAFRVAAKRTQTLLGTAMHLPGRGDLDRRLVLGSMLFGAGWGLAGYCPGPALASLASGGIKPLVFAGSMLAGMAVYEIMERLARSRAGQPA
jgi:uncharacterized membrane protein YedE/YeeE